MANTASLLLNIPSNGDPAYTNSWGTNPVNLNMGLLDAAVTGILSLSVAGSSNTILTSNVAATDQARNQQFIFSGILTGNKYVLWPNGLTRMFSVTNNCTGAFTLSIGVDDGMGAPAGTTYTVVQGQTVELYSTGTNVGQRAAAIGTGAIDNLLPSQTGNSGKFLTTNGTASSWGSIPSSGLLLSECRVYAGPLAPVLWLFCYGQAISRTTYSALFAVIGTTYGTGDGSTTFNIPDLRGRTVFGRDDMGGSAANRVTNAISGITAINLGAVGGDQNMQQHTHTQDAHTHTTQADGRRLAFLQTSGSNYDTGATSMNFTGAPGFAISSTTATNQNTGTGNSQNMPPTIIMNWIIYAGV